MRDFDLVHMHVWNVCVCVNRQRWVYTHVHRPFDQLLLYTIPPSFISVMCASLVQASQRMQNKSIRLWHCFTFYMFTLGNTETTKKNHTAIKCIHNINLVFSFSMRFMCSICESFFRFVVVRFWIMAIRGLKIETQNSNFLRSFHWAW